MLGRELELRSTEILLGYQVQQGRQGQVQQVQQGQVQQGQVQQVQEQQVQQEHQGHCSISFKNSKCSKDNEIEWSKDNKIKCGKNTHRTVGRQSKCRTVLCSRGCWVFRALVLQRKRQIFGAKTGVGVSPGSRDSALADA